MSIELRNSNYEAENNDVVYNGRRSIFWTNIEVILFASSQVRQGRRQTEVGSNVFRIRGRFIF